MEALQSPRSLRVIFGNVSVFHKGDILFGLGFGRRVAVFAAGRIAVAGIFYSGGIEPAAAGRVAIGPAEGAAGAVEDSGRIDEGAAGEIVRGCAFEVDNPGAPILPTRIIFFHPENPFGGMHELSALGKDFGLA